MAQKSQTKSLFTADLVVPAIQASFVKLNPRELIRNPVMFVTAAVAALMTVLLVVGQDDLTTGFKLQLVVWLWLTVLFGTFAEALAEGRGKAQAASLRATKAELTAKRLKNGRTEQVPASQLRAGDLVLVETNDLIPADGEVVEGVASVNEAAITGESAPVIREAGGDRSAVTAGTRVISDQVTVRVTVDPGQGFLDRMIALVEGAERQKTPNEIALTLLLVGLTIIFLIAVGTIPGFASYAGGSIPVETVEKMLARNRRGGCLVTPDTGGCAAYQAGAACRASSWRLYAAAAMVNSSAAPARPRSLSVRSPRLRFRWPNTRSIRCRRRRACT